MKQTPTKLRPLKEDIAWTPKVSYLALKHILCACHPNKILQPLCRVYESNLSKKCKYTSIVRDLKDDTNLYKQTLHDGKKSTLEEVSYLVGQWNLT